MRGPSAQWLRWALYCCALLGPREGGSRPCALESGSCLGLRLRLRGGSDAISPYDVSDLRAFEQVSGAARARALPHLPPAAERAGTSKMSQPALRRVPVLLDSTLRALGSRRMPRSSRLQTTTPIWTHQTRSWTAESKV
jgi:hypothetical protein